MYWHCVICDNIMNEEFRNKRLESRLHSSLVNSFIRRYIIPNPTPNKIDVILKKYLIIQYEKYIYNENSTFIKVFNAIKSN